MYQQTWQNGLHRLAEDLTIIATRVHLALHSSDHSNSHAYMEAVIKIIEQAGGQLHALQNLSVPSPDQGSLE